MKTRVKFTSRAKFQGENLATSKCQKFNFKRRILGTKVLVMEKNLDRVLEDIVASDDVLGCLVSDKQGLCLGLKGNMSQESSGILTAVAEQARHLNPTSQEYPIVVLETNDKQCLLQSNDKLVVTVIKSIV